ncbi:hypothetical protein ACH4MG_15315 [Streptomyces sp. NPDC017454]|uniref:hypothetical protein n=1 Tax=Streptomyces sp. NPDC017454 TaxID=3364997 RepID=UPI0037A79244
MVGPDFEALVFEALFFVSMRREDRDTVAEFERTAGEVAEAVEAQRLTSTPVMKQAVRDGPPPAWRARRR